MTLRIGLLATALLAVGCASTPVSLGDEFLQEHSPTGSSCAFSLGILSDSRRDPSDFGSLANRKVQSTDPLAWMRNGLKTLPGYQDELAPLQVDAELLMAYTQSQATSKVVNVVARLHYRQANQQTQSRTYRGSNTAINWASSESEIQSAFNNALNKLLLQIEPELSARCGSNKAEAT